MGVPYILPHINDLEPLLAGFNRVADEVKLAARLREPTFAFHFHVGETDAQAEREAQGYIQQYVDTRAVGNTKSFAELQEKGLIIVGGPDRCIRLLRRLEKWGVQRILVILNYGGMPHPLVLRSMERLAKEVVPAFQT